VEETTTPSDRIAAKGHEELAVAVADPTERAQFLTVDEKGRKIPDGWVSVRDAVRSGRSFMVRVRRSVLAVDADCPDQIVAIGILADELRLAGHTPIEIGSGRGQHLFAAPADVQGWRARARQLGLDARDWIRPPLAPHPAGLPVRLISPVTLADALAALGGVAQKRRLSPPMHALLYRGEGAGCYRSGSEAVAATALAAVDAGWTSDDWDAAIAHSRWRIVADRHRPSRRRSWLLGTWLRAVDYACLHPSRAPNELAAVVAAAEAAPWTGQAGRTDRDLLQAHIRACRGVGPVHVLPVAVAAIAVACTDRTVRAAHRRLVDAGWLEVLAKGSGPKATVWRLKVPAAQNFRPHLTPPPAGENRAEEMRALEDVGHDAWRHGALGRCGREVLEVLLAHADSGQRLSAGEIASRCPSMPHRQTVARLLARAHECGLVGCVGGLWALTCIDDKVIDEAAWVLGTVGRRAQARADLEESRARRRDAILGGGDENCGTEESSRTHVFVLQDYRENRPGAQQARKVAVARKRDPVPTLNLTEFHRSKPSRSVPHHAGERGTMVIGFLNPSEWRRAPGPVYRVNGHTC
jgi:hypothetical protein